MDRLRGGSGAGRVVGHRRGVDEPARRHVPVLDRGDRNRSIARTVPVLDVMDGILGEPLDGAPGERLLAGTEPATVGVVTRIAQAAISSRSCTFPAPRAMERNCSVIA